MSLIWVGVETLRIQPERAFVHNKIRTRIQVNKNIDSEFYHNLFCEDGGVYDMIEAKMPWLAGSSYFIQQDGARPHTANGTIEDLVARGTGDGFVPIIVA